MKQKMSTAILTNEYWENVKPLRIEGTNKIRRLPRLGPSINLTQIVEDYKRREEFVMRYSWSITAPETVSAVATELGRNAVEIGAGNGYWASLLKQLGVNITAYDERPWNPSKYPVRKGGPKDLKYIPSTYSLFLCWPPHWNEMGYESLLNFRGDRVVYIGEFGECTGTDTLHAKLLRDYTEVKRLNNITWEGINDRVHIFQRK